MALKLEVTFDVGVKIIGKGSPSIKDQIIIVCEPFTNTTSYNNEHTPTYDANNSPKINNITTFKTLYNIQNTVFTNVFVFKPTHVEEVNGKLKCTVPEEIHEAIRFIKKYNYFYEHVDGGQELKRKDTPSEISNSTKKSSTIVKNTVVGGDDDNDIIESNDEFAFEIQSGSINSKGDEITYNFTPTRELKIYEEDKELDISKLNNLAVNTLLDLTFSHSNLYYKTETNQRRLEFALKAGIILQQNNKKIVLQVDTTHGKLVQASIATIALKQSDTGIGNIVVKDQFKLGLEIAPNFTFTNNIKNPIIKASIDPSDAKDGYIVLDLYESGDDNAHLIENFTPSSVKGELANSFNISSDSYTNFKDGNVYFDNNITYNGDANTDLIVEQRQNDRDVIKLRLDRFPRHGVKYDIRYTHKLNKTSGIFNGDGHAVISNIEEPLYIKNNLQEVTATVGKLKVHYPPTVPETFNSVADERHDYTAYYYIDITFQRAGINGNVDITAKYNENYQYQTEAGDNIHHGLILNSYMDVNGEMVNIFEDITRTRIGKVDEGIFTAVNLTDNKTGKVLRIELPVAVTNAPINTLSRYPYDTTNNILTKYNLTDKTPSIFLNDREKLDQLDGETGEYYYINVMDNLGNVVSPIPTTDLTTDNDWGKDSSGNTPSVASIEYKVRYKETSGWVKELVLTHNQELHGIGSPLFTLTKNGIDMNIIINITTQNGAVIVVSLNDISENVPMLLTRDITGGNIKLEYSSDSDESYNNISNWLGFDIVTYTGEDAKLVTLPIENENSNPLPPVVQSLNIVSGINDTTNEYGKNPGFELELDWGLSGSTDGITYLVEQSTDGGNNWTRADVANTASTTGATVSGLLYDKSYTFRVTTTTYEDSEPVTITLSSQIGPAGALDGLFVYNNIGTDGYPEVEVLWNKPVNATQYKIEWNTLENFSSVSGQTSVEGLSGFDVGETTVSYTFEGEDGYLDPNKTYYFRASYSTTIIPNPNPTNISYTFSPPLITSETIVYTTTYPHEITSITVENKNIDNSLDYHELQVFWTNHYTDNENVTYLIEYTPNSFFDNEEDSVVEVQFGDNYKVLDLVTSTTYYIRIRSRTKINNDGEEWRETPWVYPDPLTTSTTNDDSLYSSIPIGEFEVEGEKA